MPLLGQLTIDEISVIVVDTDPSASGVAAPIGSVAILDNDTGAQLWLKTASGSTGWTPIPRLPTGITSLQSNTLVYTDANGYVKTDTTRFVWDQVNGRLGIGLAAPAVPQSTVHIDRGTGVGGHVRFTAGTTTGQTAGDGFEIGIDNAGNAEILNFENSHINFTTNNVRVMRLNSGGELIIGTNATTVDITGLSTFPQLQIVGSSIADVQMAAIKYGADTLPPVFNLLKSRGVAQSQGLLLADDEFGRLQFRGSDGVNFQAGASVRAAVDGTASAGSMPGRLVLMTTASGSTTPTERVRIDSTGQTIFASSIRLGDGTDTTNGNIRFNSGEIQARENSIWRVLGIAPTAITATANTSTTSATFATITGATTTPAAGTYLVMFSANCNTTGANTNGDVQLFVAGTAVDETLRNVGNTATLGTVTVSTSVSFQAVITVNGSQVVDVRFRENGSGTFKVSQRGFFLIPIAR